MKTEPRQSAEVKFKDANATAVDAAFTWAETNWHEGEKIAGADGCFVATTAFIAGYMYANSNPQSPPSAREKALVDALEAVLNDLQGLAMAEHGSISMAVDYSKNFYRAQEALTAYRQSLPAKLRAEPKAQAQVEKEGGA